MLLGSLLCGSLKVFAPTSMDWRSERGTGSEGRESGEFASDGVRKGPTAGIVCCSKTASVLLDGLLCGSPEARVGDGKRRQRYKARRNVEGFNDASTCDMMSCVRWRGRRHRYVNPIAIYNMAFSIGNRYVSTTRHSTAASASPRSESFGGTFAKSKNSKARFVVSLDTLRNRTTGELFVGLTTVERLNE